MSRRKDSRNGIVLSSDRMKLNYSTLTCRIIRIVVAPDNHSRACVKESIQTIWLDGLAASATFCGNKVKRAFRQIHYQNDSIYACLWSKKKRKLFTMSLHISLPSQVVPTDSSSQLKATGHAAASRSSSASYCRTTENMHSLQQLPKLKYEENLQNKVWSFGKKSCRTHIRQGIIVFVIVLVKVGLVVQPLPCWIQIPESSVYVALFFIVTHPFLCPKLASFSSELMPKDAGTYSW